MRIGQGFDIHRLEEGIPFILGGIPVDWPKGPKGHSDGDVLLHALIDALLGAVGHGDIGDWFPPSDPTYKNADSTELLKKVMQSLNQEHWEIINIDSTVLLEEPKLGPHKAAIRNHLATVLGLQMDQISLKAKTMESLGPIGHGDAVAAMVSVLLTQPLH